MSEDVIQNIETLVESINEDNKKQSKRLQKYEPAVDEVVEGKSLEETMIVLDKMNITQIIQNRIIANYRFMLVLNMQKGLLVKLNSLSDALSKLPDREEFDALKNSLEGDKETMISVLNGIKEGFDKQQQQDEKLVKSEEESEKIKDELRRKHGEHAIA